MKRQHAVILESIWEPDSIIIHFPAKRTGLLTPLLTCFTLLSFSFLRGQIISSPTPFLPFSFLDKHFLSPIPLLPSPGQNFSKSNFNSANLFQDNPKFCLSRKIIPVSQKYSKSHFHSDLGKFLLLCLPFAYSCHWSLNSVH